MAGRLYATLRVLQFLARTGVPRPTVSEELKDKHSPRDRIQALGVDLFADLVTAVQEGRHAAAMGEVFRALPAVVPPRKAALDKNLGEWDLTEFNAGYRAQLTALQEALPEVLR